MCLLRVQEVAHDILLKNYWQRKIIYWQRIRHISSPKILIYLRLIDGSPYILLDSKAYCMKKLYESDVKLGKAFNLVVVNDEDKSLS